MKLKITLAFCLGFLSISAYAEKVENIRPAEVPFSSLTATDALNDAGGAVEISWQKMNGSNNDQIFFLMRSESNQGPFVKVTDIDNSSNEYTDQGVRNGRQYFYRIEWPEGTVASVVSQPVIARAAWFNTQRFSLLFALIIFTGLIIYYIGQARKGVVLFVRQIAGLSAVDEAIGRATEMGRPILYLPSGGLSAVSDIQTLASLVILGRVASKAAEYETPLLVPCSDPLVMTLAQEIVKAGYMNAGRPDAYRAEHIRYLTNEQFAYTAGVDGIMLREKPAANFMIGTFYAESLILAETGFATGAIQIAGTASITQLPFFVAACDYTLIGEEIYAASAYLSKEPVLMGTIKAQDWGKALAIGLIIIGVILETLALKFPQLHFFASQWLVSQ
jgi:hypothetical protein